MPETFAPFTWNDGAGGGTPITAAQLNRLETGLESMDDRAAALELGVNSPVTLTYAASLTINATQGALFRVVATGNLTLTDITGGTNGQLISLEVRASGGDRVFTAVGESVTIPSGQRWSGDFRYDSLTDEWTLRTGGSGGSGGSGGGSGYATVQDEGAPRTQRTAMNFVGTGVTVTDDSANSRTLVTIPGGSGYATVQDEGAARTQRATLNFAGAGVTVTDDSANSRTLVTIPGGGGGASIYLAADATGVTNAAPAIQAAYDAGASAIFLDPAGRYLLNSGIFLDSTDGRRKFVIHGNGARLLLGSGLPTVAEYRDTTTRWAFFVAIKRVALSGGVVTATDQLSTDSGYGPMSPAFTIRDAVVDGQAANRALAFGNFAASMCEAVTLYQAKALISWIDYPDGNTLRNCRFENPYDSDSWMLDQISNGDGTVVDGCQADANAGIARLSQCNGGYIGGIVSGPIKLSNCHSILIMAPHLEAHEDIRVRTPIEIINSTVTIDSGEFWPDPANRWAAITINDNTDEDENSSDVTIRDTTARATYYDIVQDVANSPFLRIAAANLGTRVRFDRVTGALNVVGLTTYWRMGLKLASNVAGITTAITNNLATIATGSFEIRYRAGAWQVASLALPGVAVTRALAAPVLDFVGPGEAPQPQGTLTNGTSYQYAMAVIDAFGNYSENSGAVSATAGADGVLVLYGAISSYPSRLVIWRRTGAGVLATPNRYVVVPHDGRTFRFYDTGANINFTPWVTTAVPVPNTVAATNTTKSGLLLEGGGMLYVESGALKYRGAGGTVTTLGNT